MLFDLGFSFLGWDIKTSVTDTLSIVGFSFLFLVPICGLISHKNLLNERLFTLRDGKKLFEKLKYDLKYEGDLKNINPKKLYTNRYYARTIFAQAMEYNEREFTWYFNEKDAKKMIFSLISKSAWSIFFMWFLFIATVLMGTHLDFFRFFFEFKKMNETSGRVSILVLFIFFICFQSLLKWKEYLKVKKVVNDEVRRINLAKKNKVWRDYKIVYFFQLGVISLGFLFMIINLFF